MSLNVYRAILWNKAKQIKQISNSEAREWHHNSDKQNGVVEDLKLFQAREQVFLTQYFLFLSEHAYVVWSCSATRANREPKSSSSQPIFSFFFRNKYMSGFMKTVSRLNQVFLLLLFTFDICLFIFFCFRYNSSL